jgi:hypothetical protein
MSIVINNYSDHADDDENRKFVSIILENHPDERSSTPKLRSILRKHGEKKVFTKLANNVRQTSIDINEKENNNERDSDYTGDENDDDDDDDDDEENNANNIIIKKASQTKEPHYRHFSRQQQKDQFVQKFSSTSFVNPLEIKKEKTDSIVNGRSSTRTTCVKFTNEQPTIFRRSSSTPPNIEQRSSVTFINMKEDLPKTTTITTGFRPVYVPPLKYRPLLGLSANDSRLLLEKRVSLLGKPLVLHPIQKRSLAYRRTQLCIYNFLERADGYKAIIYHTFV